MCAPLRPDCGCHDHCPDGAACRSLERASNGQVKAHPAYDVRARHGDVNTTTDLRRRAYLKRLGEGAPQRHVVQADDPNYDESGIQYGGW